MRALTSIEGHGQSADIFQPKTRYLQQIFHGLSDEVKFEFEFLSGILPAYPDDGDREDQKVWGYGDPSQDQIRGFEYSIEHIIDRMVKKGPFSGIVGFSSGGTMAAIITSLLERETADHGTYLKVKPFYRRNVIQANSTSDSPPTFEICYQPKWLQAGQSPL